MYTADLYIAIIKSDMFIGLYLLTQACSKSLVVAAIDFGTTYSGVAFSFRHDYEMNPRQVHAKQWSGGQLVSLKGIMKVDIGKY